MATDPLDRFPDGIASPQQWLDGLLPRLPSVGTDFVKHELLSTLRDFCRESAAWRDWLEIVLVAGTSRYALQPSFTGAEALYVYEGQLLKNPAGSEPWQTAPMLPLSWPQPGRLAVAGQPTGWWQRLPGEIDLEPTPTATEAGWRGLFHTSLVPTDLLVPDWLRGEYFDPICDGVLARVYTAPGPTQDKELALFHRRLYLAGRSRARVRTREGYSLRYGRLYFPYFAVGRQIGI